MGGLQTTGIRGRLLGAFSLVTFVCLATAAYSLHALQEVRSSFDAAVNKGTIALASLQLADALSTVSAVASQLPYMGYAEDSQKAAREMLSDQRSKTMEFLGLLRERGLDPEKLSATEDRVNDLLKTLKELDEMLAGWRELRPNRTALYQKAHTSLTEISTDPQLSRNAVREDFKAAWDTLVRFEWSKEVTDLELLQKEFAKQVELAVFREPDQQVKRIADAWQSLGGSVADLRRQEMRNFVRFSQLLGDEFDKFAQLRSDVAGVQDIARTEARQSYADALGTFRQSWYILAAFALLSMALSAIFIVFYVDRQLLARLSGLSAGMLRLADGETGIRIDGQQYKDELGRLARSLEIFRTKLIERLRLEQEYKELNEHLEEQVEARTQDLQETAERLQEVNRRLEEAHRQLTESVQYASRIQRSMLPSTATMNGLFAQHALCWEPRDGIGGDYYWLQATNRGYVVVLADCTGHGVPGALLSVIVAMRLRNLLERGTDSDPAEILTALDRSVRQALHHGQEEVSDFDNGLDAAVVVVDVIDRKLHYAGAGIPFAYVQDGRVGEFKPDGARLGYRTVRGVPTFRTQTLDLAGDLHCYLATDGIFEQVGGTKRRMFGRKRFLELLDGSRSEPTLKAQLSTFMREFLEWQKDELRRDDLTFLAFSPR